MSTSTVGLFLRHLALSEEVGRLGMASDHDLLATYESERGQAAFTELVRRHGPMVLRTCRRLLGRGPDAEDAFQATFILLARQAGQLGREAAGRQSLGGWLHRVAYRTAANVLRRAARRRVHERQVSVMSHPEPDPSAEATWNEVRPILDVELDALPDEARRLLIACYLQDKTYSEAAAELGVPRGSVAWRLEKARALLEERLIRRGIAVSASLLAVLLGEAARGAGVPAILLVHTVEAARTFTEHINGMVSDSVARLVKGGLKMIKGPTHWSMALAGWVGLLGAGLLACQTLKAWPDQKPENEPSAAEQRAQEGDKLVRMDRYGDPLPPGALARLGTVRLRHNADVRSLAFTPDGKGLLTAGGDNFPRLWEATTGKLVREFTNIPKPQFVGDTYFGVSAAVLSPDGRIMAVRSGPMGSLYLLDTATGKRLHEFPCKVGYAGSTPFVNFAFSPDCKMIAALLDGNLELRDVATGELRWREKEEQIVALAFSPDGKTLAVSVGGEGVRLWDVRTGKRLRALGPKCLTVPIAFSPDGRTLLLGCGANKDRENRNSVHLWDVATGKKVRQLSAPDQGYYYPAFSPDGKIVAARRDLEGGICLWEAATGKELRRWPDVPYHWNTAAFSPDGKVLAALDGLIVRFWDVASGKTRSFQLPPGHESRVNSVAFTPDGRTLISAAGDHTLRWWDTTTSQQRLCLPGTKDLLRFSGVRVPQIVSWTCKSALSPDGTMLAATCVDALDEEHPAQEAVKGLRIGIRLLDAATGKELRHLDGGNGWVEGLTFSPDGQLLAEDFRSVRERSGVQLWDVASGKPRDYKLAGTCPQFSPDGSLLATRDGWISGKVIHFWEAATGKEVHALHTNEDIRCLALSPGGKTLATGSDRITLYPLSRDKPSGVRVGEPRLAAPSSNGTVTALAFSLDGRMLASSGDDHAIHVWETVSGKECTRIAGHGKARTMRSKNLGVTSLCFTADGRQLASGSVDSTILIWDVTGRLQEGQLRPAHLSPKELEELWTDLRGADAVRARRALWTLAAAPDQAVPYLAERLQTLVADTKAQLAKVPQLLRDLDDDAFAVREKARAELTRLGAAVEPALRQALTKSPSVEMRRSLEQLLEAVEAKRQEPTGELLRALRALEVLEQIGTRPAREVLKALTADGEADFSLTREAHAALKRLDRTELR